MRRCGGQTLRRRCGGCRWRWLRLSGVGNGLLGLVRHGWGGAVGAASSLLSADRGSPLGAPAATLCRAGKRGLACHSVARNVVCFSKSFVEGLPRELPPSGTPSPPSSLVRLSRTAFAIETSWNVVAKRNRESSRVESGRLPIPLDASRLEVATQEVFTALSRSLAKQGTSHPQNGSYVAIDTQHRTRRARPLNTRQTSTLHEFGAGNEPSGRNTWSGLRGRGLTPYGAVHAAQASILHLRRTPLPPCHHVPGCHDRKRRLSQLHWRRRR